MSFFTNASAIDALSSDAIPDEEFQLPLDWKQRVQPCHFYRRKLVQKGLGKARVAVARKLGVRLWIMFSDEIDYEGSVVADRSSKVVQPVRGCLKSGKVRTVTVRLIRRPALPE